MATANLAGKAKKGAAYNTGARLVGTFAQAIGTIILARLLAPEDFGLVATGMLIIGFTTKFGEFGFRLGLVQMKGEITEKHVNTLFVMDFTFKFVLWIIIFFLTPWVASYFNDPRLLTALPFITFYMVLECLSATPQTVLQRELDFKNRSVVLMSELFITLFVSIAMAALGYGYWSLIIGHLAGVMSAGIVGISITRWLPKIKYDHQAGKELFSFGVMIFFRNLFRYGADNIDYFFISRYLGPQALGFYEKAFNLMKMPQRRITTSINAVVFSVFAKLQDEPERIRNGFRKLVLLMSLVNYPILAAMAYLSPIFIPLALGERWQPAVVPLQVMCIAGLFRSLDPFLNSVLTSSGFVKSTATRRFYEFILVGIGAFVGVRWGINGVAIGITIAAVLVMVFMVALVTKMSSIKWVDYFGPQIPAVITSLIMLGAMFLTSMLLSPIVAPKGFIMFFALTGVGAISYLGSHLLFRFPSVVRVVREFTGDAKGILSQVSKKFTRIGGRFSFAAAGKTDSPAK